MWGRLLSPNMEYLKLWACIRAVTLRCNDGWTHLHSI